MGKTLLYFLISLFFASLTAQAELVSYVDESGRTHYVEGLDRVPEKYRASADANLKLRPITKLPSVMYQPPKLPVPGNPFSQSATPKIEIFVTSWCPYCKRLEDYLKTRKLDYVRYDIEKDKAGARIHQQLGGGGIPVIRIGTKIIRGYQPEEIEAELAKSRIKYKDQGSLVQSTSN